MLVPHIGCLAALAPLAVGTGAGAAAATAMTYSAGMLAAAGGLGAAWWGLRPSQADCCRIFGSETPRIRLRKGLAMAAFGFVAAAGINTLRDGGFPIAARVTALESTRAAGGSIWEQQRQLDLICVTRP